MRKIRYISKSQASGEKNTGAGKNKSECSDEAVVVVVMNMVKERELQSFRLNPSSGWLAAAERNDCNFLRFTAHL